MQAGALHCHSCGAVVSGDSVQCQYCKAALQTVSCPKCFGLMFRGGKFCPHCGAEAAASVVEQEAKGLCPRCDVRLTATRVGDVRLEECSRCGGLWVEVAVFERICSDRQAQTAAMGIVLPPPVEAEEGVKYLKCPRCAALMTRRNYAHRSGVIVDICRPHGVWFDRDELRRIIEFIRAGGLERSRQLEKAEIEQERSRLESERIARSRDQMLTSSEVPEARAADVILGGLGLVLRWLMTR